MLSAVVLAVKESIRSKFVYKFAGSLAKLLAPSPEANVQHVSAATLNNSLRSVNSSPSRKWGKKKKKSV